MESAHWHAKTEKRPPFLCNCKIHVSGYTTRHVSLNVLFCHSSVHRTIDPSNHRTIELTNQRSVEPSNRSINRATDPLNHRTFKPESDVASDINVQNTVRSGVTGELVYSAPALPRSVYKLAQFVWSFIAFGQRARWCGNILISE